MLFQGNQFLIGGGWKAYQAAGTVSTTRIFLTGPYCVGTDALYARLKRAATEPAALPSLITVEAGTIGLDILHCTRISVYEKNVVILTKPGLGETDILVNVTNNTKRST